MKAALTVLAAMALAGPLLARPTTTPAPKQSVKLEVPAPQKKGRWQMAESGRAVYCYGPVVIMSAFDGQPKRFATQCRGQLSMVPLRD